jgi:phage tail sheath protein FI
MLDRAPRGAVVLTAQTLAPDAALQPIGTRRLLILLRRLAERVGPSLVFESNRPALRRQAAAVFERVLSDLYRRGALAGTTAREAYRVVADASVNPPERVERGQLVVEVRVAPARPLEFITIRLVQRGEQAFTVHEG